ncbi:hypothetical protein L204_105895 [Cryptococcus depauperatus]
MARAFYARMDEQASKTTSDIFLSFGQCSQKYQRIWGIEDPPVGQGKMNEEDEEWEKHVQRLKVNEARSNNEEFLGLHLKIDQLEKTVEDVKMLLTERQSDRLKNSALDRIRGRSRADGEGDGELNEGMNEGMDEELALAYSKVERPRIASPESQSADGPEQIQDVKEALFVVFGEQARWKNRFQEKAARMISTTKENCFIVGPTTVGKTLTWALPALLESNGFTVVIVPLVALKEEYLAKLKTYSIAVSEWTGPIMQGPQRAIVLVSVEEAGTFEFVRWLGLYKDRCKRIVMEEAHIILTSASYRWSMHRLKLLAGLEIPKVLVSATIPPHLVETMLKQLWLEEAMVLRTATTMRNFIYFMQHRKAKSQAIVFCQRKVETKIVVKELEKLNMTATGFTSTSNNLGEVQNDFGEVDKNNIWFLACTNGLGAGVNFPNVDMVFFLGPPQDFLDFAQCSGRAGRRGQVSRIVLINIGRPFRTEHDKAGKKAYEEWVSQGEKMCLRKVLDEYLDGESDYCSQIWGAEWCEFCVEMQLPMSGDGRKGEDRTTKKIVKHLGEDEWEGVRYEQLSLGQKYVYRLGVGGRKEECRVVMAECVRRSMNTWWRMMRVLKGMCEKFMIEGGGKNDGRERGVYCGYCFGLKKLERHGSEECEEFRMMEREDEKSERGEVREIREGLRGNKVGVCENCWLPAYFRDEKKFHDGEGINACKYFEPVPFVPRFWTGVMKDREGRWRNEIGIVCEGEEMVRMEGRRGERGLLVKLFEEKGILKTAVGWKVMIECGYRLGLVEKKEWMKLREGWGYERWLY